MRELLRYGNGGWVHYSADDPDLAVHVRFSEGGNGRLEVADVFMPFDQAPSATTLHAAADAVARVEAVVNWPENRDHLTAKMKVPGVDLRTLVAFSGTTFGPKVDHWVARSLREPPPKAPRRRDVRQLSRPDPGLELDRLEVPEGRGRYPDSFYQQFAATYRALVAGGESPAAVISDKKGVPATTVHRWAREARRRGFLPSGRQGRAG